MPPSRPSIERVWQRRGAAALLMLPLALLFSLIAGLRRSLFRLGLLTSERLPVPVIVVGNVTVGGAGKTPLVIWLVEELRRRGRRPGVVSRGYGGRNSKALCAEVTEASAAAAVGDEPLLIRRRTGVPVFVGRDRAAAGRALLAAHDCDLIVCDDGLQHYRLARDFEVAVVDRRGFLNGLLLPAGPLREPPRRLNSVTAVVANGWSGPAGFQMRLEGGRFQRLDDPQVHCQAADLSGKRLHAVAGIGEPRRFFDHLRALGLDFSAHPFPDHHAYCAQDLAFDGDAILTTEKDAVKFSGLARLTVWVLPVSAVVTPDLAQFLMEKINGSPSA